MRRLLGLRAKSRVLIEERDGGILISPVSRRKAIAAIDYLPEGAITLSKADYALDLSEGEDDIPSA